MKQRKLAAAGKISLPETPAKRKGGLGSIHQPLPPRLAAAVGSLLFSSKAEGDLSTRGKVVN